MAESGYGKTLAVEADGDLKFTTLNGPEYIEGTRAVVQDMKVTLATPQGEDPMDSEHGLDMFTAAGGTEQELRFAISETLTAEFGDVIQEIESIDITEDENRRRHVSINITLVDNERYAFGVIV